MALELWYSLGLVNNSLPFKTILDLSYPFYKFHLFQVLPDIVLGLPTGLLVNSFHVYILFTVLVSGILFMCPKQLNLCALTQFIMFRCFISFFNSLLAFTVGLIIDAVGLSLG